ncbi:TPA: hypothetical protein ACH7UU_004799, partial [Escherichia coli]
AGRRRHLPAALHLTSAGASMPLTRHPVTFPFGALVFCPQAYQFFTLREYKMAPGQQNGHQSNNQFCQVPLMSQFFNDLDPPSPNSFCILS